MGNCHLRKGELKRCRCQPAEQSGPHGNVSSDSDPLLQLKAASGAVCVAAQDCVHVLPQRKAVMPFPKELAAALPMPTGGVQG